MLNFVFRKKPAVVPAAYRTLTDGETARVAGGDPEPVPIGGGMGPMKTPIG